ncbi:MAG: YifB family Mg chelatase-like AAA ATPase [Acidimicrobiales bacterium]|nr:YifB family Mg chelatase-like AAA ATPase [Acidimicrobiales bacterium]RZV41596.1 MAG: ATP-binding protein [Acidimicrobiales bacterium]
MLATVQSATLTGVRGHKVEVEVHAPNGGLPGFNVVGLPDASCREARDRVRAALLSSGFDWPNRRITVNLAPSGLKKTGAGLDLAIAIGLLAASEKIDPASVTNHGFLGELGLDGSVRPVVGALPMADAINADRLVVAPENAEEVSLLGRKKVHAMGTLSHVLACLEGIEPWPDTVEAPAAELTQDLPDLSEIRGQRTAKLALEIAAAGGHHLLMVGPPGAGKTMLARRLPSLLPPLSSNEALETTRVHSAAAQLGASSVLCSTPPFRSPHHGASAVSLVGGGSATMRPGELSLAHRGVLFLDELGEFTSAALDGLRQPLEEGEVRVSRGQGSVLYPARVLLVAAMNPCPCGESGAPGACRCTDAARARYHRRVSGPLLDRFDLRIGVQRPSSAELFGGPQGEVSTAVAERVSAARQRAVERSRLNVQLGTDELDELAPLGETARGILERSVEQGQLSARGVGRVRAVALTIADLAGETPPITPEQICLAMSLRVDPFGGRS